MEVWCLVLAPGQEDIFLCSKNQLLEGIFLGDGGLVLVLAPGQEDIFFCVVRINFWRGYFLGMEVWCWCVCVF